MADEDELECFKRAAELECPDFFVCKADDSTCFVIPEFLNDMQVDEGESLPHRELRFNRYAAAVCAEWWINRPYTNHSQAHIDAIWADKARAFGKKYGGMLLLFLTLSLPTFAAENAFSFAQVVDLSPVAPMGCSLPIAADGMVGSESRTAYGWAVAYKNDGKDTLLVSARHVLEHHDLTLRSSRICINEHWFDLQLEKESARLDLVILRLKNQHLKCYPIVPMNELADGAEFQRTQMFLKGALAGTPGSPSGRGIVDSAANLRAIVIRQESVNGMPVMGQVTAVPCEVLTKFVGGK